MQIIVHTTAITLSEALREYLERRVSFALSRLNGRVKRVVVHLADVNGPRGGVDKHCSVQVHLQTAPTVVIEEADADVYVLLDRALTRAGRAAAKRIERSQQFVRHGHALATEGDRLSEMRDRRRRLPLQSKSHEYE